jgi:Cysteine-rich CWC
MCKHEEKKCPVCNVTFECKPGNIVQCQCYGILLSPEEKALLEEKYDDCLCRRCLKHESSRILGQAQETNERESNSC